MPPLPENLDESARWICQEMYQSYGCIPIAGGTVRSSELSAGASYTFWEPTMLILDADCSLKTLCCAGGLTIEGDAQFSSEVIYAACTGVLTVHSGTILCPVMDTPPEPDAILNNGLCGFGGVTIKGGSVTCPEISGCSEMVVIDGGTVKADAIHALFGYSQRGGDVEASYIWGREGVSISDGTLTAGTIEGGMVGFYGGVSLVHKVTTEVGDSGLELSFPMVITEPSGARYVDGVFIDEAGNPVEQVRIEKVSVDVPFTDISGDAYYYNSVAWAVYKNITSGVSETLFAPDRVCTRAQAMTFLWRASGSPKSEHLSLPFSDIEPGSYYAEAVCWAVENGITKGTSENTFSPNRSCTRAEIITFL